MAKLTREQRLEIYEKKKEGITRAALSLEYGIDRGNIQYLIRLIDHHGPDILRNNQNKYYSPELKEEIINKVLIERNGMISTAIEYGLTNRGTLSNWIKDYNENGCVIVEKSRGRPTMTKPKPNKKYDDMTDEEKLKFLEEKNLYLEAEVTYLKKLKAVVQAREMREQKKK